jgi:hypothetical protein
VARYRVLALALLVTALLAIVGLAAHGRPLSRGGDGRGARAGTPALFFDYVWTTFVILFVLVLVAWIAGFWFFRHERGNRRPYWLTLRSLGAYFLVAILFILFGRHLFHFRHFPRSGVNRHPVPPSGNGGQTGSNGGAAHGHNVFQWSEVFAVLGVLIAVSAVLYLRRTRGVLPAWRDAPESLALALDDSLDDLRTDPDLRRAIVAAYARMETALAVAGIPRRPAEAPLEYVERALVTLDASAEAVRRLTDLFEWARFSHHEPEPAMRDEAVDALIAVRDELRASELIPA